MFLLSEVWKNGSRIPVSKFFKKKSDNNAKFSLKVNFFYYFLMQRE